MPILSIFSIILNVVLLFMFFTMHYRITYLYNKAKEDEFYRSLRGE